MAASVTGSEFPNTDVSTDVDFRFAEGAGHRGIRQSETVKP